MSPGVSSNVSPRTHREKNLNNNNNNSISSNKIVLEAETTVHQMLDIYQAYTICNL